MPLTGSSSVLAALIKSKRLAKLDPSQVGDDDAMSDDCAAIAEAVVEHILANAVIAPGIPVATAGGPAAQVGATTGPGTIT